MEVRMSRNRIRELNDAFRKGERPVLGCILITSGVRDLISAWPLGIAVVYEKVKSFDAFDEDNNPHGENDFGSFEHSDETLFWKLDYYDKDVEYGSEDPADEKITTRVLTIMLASEY
jgi:hypothetical protein